MSDLPPVDLWFPVVGSALPADHGFPLFAAISHHLPAVHRREDWPLHTLRGPRTGRGDIVLTRRPQLGLRLPAELIGEVLGLVGQTLHVRGHRLTLGPPRVEPLTPAPALSARLVVIQGFDTQDTLIDAAARQLHAMGVTEMRLQAGRRQVLHIHGQAVVGYGLRVEGLSDEASLRVQAEGVGGRRRFGCGVFRRSEFTLKEDARPLRVA